MVFENPKINSELAADLRAAGIKPGDFLLMQSSFKSIGIPEITPSDVIATIMDVVGSEGTLMAPTYTYSYSGIFENKPFNIDKTPGCNVGVLTEALRRYPGALRSGHPTHSVAALGKYAKRITENKELASALGCGSPSDEAYKLGAKIFLLGVRGNRNSMLHYAEAVSGVPYNHIPFRVFWGRTGLVEKDSRVIEVPLVEIYPSCSENFMVADEYLAEIGIAHRVTIGQAKSIVMSAREMVDAVVARLKREPAWLLCDDFACEPCNNRKHELRRLGLI